MALEGPAGDALPWAAMSPADEILVHRVIARLNVGGPAMHVVHLARGLDDAPPLSDGRAFRTRLVAGSVMESEGDMAYFAAERGVEVTTIPEMARAVAPLRDRRSFLALWRFFRRERPHVVHTHTSFSWAWSGSWPGSRRASWSSPRPRSGR